MMGRAEIYTFTYMGTAARHYLKLASDSVEMEFYNSMTAILYAAFTVEAYLNHLSREQFRFWSVIERSLRPKEKLEVLSQHMHFPIDYGHEPCQSFAQALKLRDFVAHGKTKEYDWPDTLPTSPPKSDKMPEADWEKLVTLSNAERIVKNVHELVRSLHKKAGYDVDPFVVHKSGSRWGP